MCRTAKDFVLGLELQGTSSATVDTYLDEAVGLLAEIRARSDNRLLDNPQIWGVENETAKALYTLVRITRPSTVLETGIGNGVSSFIILSALSSNNHGRLISTEVSSRVGAIVGGDEKARWTVQTFEPRTSTEEFVHLVEGLDSIDLFMHDSDHSYNHQSMEYTSVLPKMSGNSLITSDDVDYSYAFVDFTEDLKTRAKFLLDGRKVFGAVRPPHLRASATGNPR